MRDDEKRMSQLVLMFSDITGKSHKEAKEIILETETGIAVAEKNEIVLYEQQTENLYSIAMELYEKSEYRELAKLFTAEKIVQSLKCLQKKIKPEMVWSETDFSGNKSVTSKNNCKYLKNRQKAVLAAKRQNQKIHRRIQNAD